MLVRPFDYRLPAALFDSFLLGKTILASRIIEERLRLNQQSIVFFYCKYQDEQRKTFLAIARSILSQLLNVDDDILPYLYDQCIGSGQVSLVSTQTSVELLKTCLQTVPQTYIVIDGIDECEYSERKVILSFFTSLIDNDINPGRLRGLFVSQDENDIRKILRNASVLRLTEEHNKSDIEAYASHWLSKIVLKFGIPDVTLEYIKAAVLGGCEGNNVFYSYYAVSFPSLMVSILTSIRNVFICQACLDKFT